MSDKNTDPLLKEFEQMRHTLSQFVQVIKKQNERIAELEAKTAHLKATTAEQALLDRYTASSLRNRNLNADPKVIAYTAHLYHLKQVPAVRISSFGLLSQSKMHGLSQWDNQHLLDFCELNGLTDVYQNGLPDDEAKELVSDWQGMQDYLANRKDEPAPTKLEKAVKKANEQQAKPIDFTAR